MSCIILKKTWSVISESFLLSWIFHYISNWSKLLEFYLTSFFNIKSWRVIVINFLGGFPVHYVVLFKNRTIKISYITLLMALHASYSWWILILFLDASSKTLSCFPMLNLIIKSIRVAAVSLMYFKCQIILVTKKRQ